MDAQGRPILVESVRIAEVKFGPVIFRERFIITAPISPLISMGRLLKDQCERQHVTSTIHSAAIAHVAEMLLAVNGQTDKHREHDVVGDVNALGQTYSARIRSRPNA